MLEAIFSCTVALGAFMMFFQSARRVFYNIVHHLVFSQWSCYDSYVEWGHYGGGWRHISHAGKDNTQVTDNASHYSYDSLVSSRCLACEVCATYWLIKKLYV